VDEIAGKPGELLVRLVDLLNCDALGNKAWYDLSSYALFFLGGKALDHVVPDTGVDPLPGTVGEEMRQTNRVVSRETYFEMIGQRLLDLVAGGLEEAFLVRSVRDAVRREVEFMADVGTGDRNRAEIRAHIERRAEDPAEVAAFRALLATRDPSAEMRSDDEIAARLREMAAHLAPTSPDGALARWALLTHWDEQATSFLPDAVFDEWRLRLARGLK
jgi:hypothetical protein